MNDERMNKKILRNISNIVGQSIKRKVVVIESDDWGSIRMPSKQVMNKLQKRGLNVSGDALRYNLYDTLANKEDLSALFHTLSSFRDTVGNSPVLTAVCVVANPDFEKIRKCDFRQYHYESFTKTLERYYGVETPFHLWMEGIKRHLFMPQFHGREHLNVAVWMKALQENDSQTRFAFDQSCWGFNNIHPYGITYQAAYELELEEHLPQQATIIEDGLNLFEQLFGYRATFFVPPNGPFNNTLEAVAAKNGIQFMSASKIQSESLGMGMTRKVFHYLGQKNMHGQHYLTRNCFFEPSQSGRDWLDSCLNDINIAFRYKKPAVISSHRVNYIGALDPANRANGLLQLSVLLKRILQKWPNVEFMTSDELGHLVLRS